jgi:hypothetical protein
MSIRHGPLVARNTPTIRQFDHETLGLPGSLGHYVATRSELEKCCTERPMARSRNDILPRMDGQDRLPTTSHNQSPIRRAVSEAVAINGRLRAAGIDAFAPQFQLLSIVDGARAPDLTAIDPIPLHLALGGLGSWRGLLAKRMGQTGSIASGASKLNETAPRVLAVKRQARAFHAAH